MADVIRGSFLCFMGIKFWAVSAAAEQDIAKQKADQNNQYGKECVFNEKHQGHSDCCPE